MKKLILTLIISLCLTISLYASVESSYRKMKRDAKTREQMANDPAFKSDNSTLIIILVIGGLFIAVIGGLSAISNKQLKAKNTLQRNALVNDFSNMFNVEYNILDQLLKKQIVFKVSAEPIEKFDFYQLDLKIKEFNQLLKIDSIPNEYQNLLNIQNTLKQELKKSKLIMEYGKEIGLKLFNHNYFTGMSQEQLIKCKGNPTKIETEVLRTKTKEIYIYGNKSSGDIFTFVNNKLEQFKDK